MSNDQKPEIEMKDYTYEDLSAFAKEWADMNDMDADMMQGILQMGINTYESTYAGYSLAMQAYNNFEAKDKDEGK